MLLARGGLRTTLQTRTEEQAERLRADGENRAYLPDVRLPADLKIEPASAGLAKFDLVFLGVPSRGLDEVITALPSRGLEPRASVISLAKGLVPPDGQAPSWHLRNLFGPHRIAVVGGPAHAREMVDEGAGLVAASESEELAHAIALTFNRAGVVCEESNDPIGVELAATSSPRSGATPTRSARAPSR